ncbi:hypothetical protein M5K25_016026 [Dendrobium thyrsiflorum]|uniref:DUF4283 domain-containing protein n=1 Tax=Dendrobium thyrsiflorum TaxID=117978 RepID=A0ABD0UYR9_DENTH
MSNPPSAFAIGAGPSPSALSYSNIVSSPRPGNAFTLSSSPSLEDPLDFTEVHVKAARDEWGLSLVGYSIGRRPYYESLLSAIRKTWTLKGMLKLLSLSEGFFMLKFSSPDDYEMALAGGVWFFLGKPFVLQKWVPNFKPVREEFSSIPIWFKILDLPLPCWTPEGISRIASKVGVPLAVDDLTAEKSRLTYARVCVQVTKNCAYPESIPISILGEPFDLKIQYEWKPSPCEHCGSIVHSSDFCPTKPQLNNSSTQPQIRGRSSSRKPPRPHNRPTPSQMLHAPTSTNTESVPHPPSTRQNSPKHIDTPAPPSILQPPVIAIPAPSSSSALLSTTIPNLNSPTEELPNPNIALSHTSQDKVGLAVAFVVGFRLVSSLEYLDGLIGNLVFPSLAGFAFWTMMKLLLSSLDGLLGNQENFIIGSDGFGWF